MPGLLFTRNILAVADGTLSASATFGFPRASFSSLGHSVSRDLFFCIVGRGCLSWDFLGELLFCEFLASGPCSTIIVVSCSWKAAGVMKESRQGLELTEDIPLRKHSLLLPHCAQYSLLVYLKCYLKTSRLLSSFNTSTKWLFAQDSFMASWVLCCVATSNDLLRAHK